MDAFWKWLMRANARGVFVGSLVGLVLVTGWWTWKEAAPQHVNSVATGPGNHSPKTGFGVQEFLDEQLSHRPQAPDTPFRSVRAKQSSRPVPNLDDPSPIVPVAPIPNTNPDPHPPTPTPHNPVERIEIVYRGILRGTDERILALIEDSKTKRCCFYAPGEVLHGLEVDTINAQSVDLRQANGSVINLRLRRPETFAGGKHVP